MRARIPNQIRVQVMARANYRCEYCQLPAIDYLLRLHVDHIRSLKHEGSSSIENLACCCPDCNANKGTDQGTFLNGPGSFTRFFNPRIDRWSDHFEAFEGALYPKTPIAEATIKILQLNDPDRVIIRQELAIDGRWPVTSLP
ncbi:MAG: HNH endonuclease [Phycisphaerae bacterium]|nr:HNH endonuclease [Saprospiraceae bacterium]